MLQKNFPKSSSREFLARRSNVEKDVLVVWFKNHHAKQNYLQVRLIFPNLVEPIYYEVYYVIPYLPF